MEWSWSLLKARYLSTAKSAPCLARGRRAAEVAEEVGTTDPSRPRNAGPLGIIKLNGTTERTAEKVGLPPEKFPHGAKARTYFQRLTAPLKPCPDTNQSESQFFSNL
jgi:hypothetical protein